MVHRLFLLLLCIFAGSQIKAQTRTLDYFLATATETSPVLKDYSSQVHRNAYDSAIIASSGKPQINGVGNVMLAPTYKGWGYDEAITNGANYTAIVSVNQAVFSKKTNAPQFDELRIRNFSAANSSAISAHDLQRNVTNQYLVAYSSLTEISYNHSLLKLLKDEQVVLENFVNQGIYRQTDFLALDLEIKIQELRIQQLLVQYKTDLGELNALCGIEDTAYYELTIPGITTFSGFKQPYVSPFILQFRLDSMRITNSRQMIDIRYRPHLNWFADGGLQASRLSFPEKNVGFSFGLSYIIPIYDGRKRGFEYQKLSIDEQIRRNYQDFFTLQQRIRINQLKIQISGTENLIVREKSLLKTSDALITANKLLLEKGQSSISEFILAVKNNMEIKQQLNQAESTRLQLNNELNYWNW
ncbi:MAG: TolC family protein [Bacteroidia bacterium]